MRLVPVAGRAPGRQTIHGARELYWLPSGGILDTELDVDAVQRMVGLHAVRTMGTMEGVAKKLA